MATTNRITLDVGDLVAVAAAEGEKPGRVRYTCPNGDLGVSLVNEKGRADEWMAGQVRRIGAAEAVELAKPFLPPALGGTRVDPAWMTCGDDAL